MMGSLKQVLLAGCLIAAGSLACKPPTAIRPSKPVPPGTMLFQFTRKVQGPVELTVDGIRVPVTTNGKKCKHLAVTGLAAGKHRFVLLSALDAFSPDQVEADLPAGSGAFKVLFSQQFNSVLYGKAEPAPAADGIPGVKASLLP